MPSQSTTYEFERKGQSLMVKKNGQPFSKQPYYENHLTSAHDYASLFDSNGFEWWGVLRDYYRADAPAEWTTTVTTEGD